ncbi:hypothetical protein CEF21_06165 [Bacillus sp. FJAT-42376]|nr:hypothetical protein CEF21_06165 [Bacillus sp. FJAT-42376]
MALKSGRIWRMARKPKEVARIRWNLARKPSDKFGLTLCVSTKKGPAHKHAGPVPILIFSKL